MERSICRDLRIVIARRKEVVHRFLGDGRNGYICRRDSRANDLSFSFVPIQILVGGFVFQFHVWVRLYNRGAFTALFLSFAQCAEKEEPRWISIRPTTLILTSGQHG